MSDKTTVGKGENIVVNESSAVSTKTKSLNNQRRRILVGGSLTGVAAAVWHKPLVNAIALPAHAQTSAPAAMAFFGAGSPAADSVARSLLDLLIPEAHAGAIVSDVESVMASIVQNELDGTEYTASILVDLGGNLSSRFEQVQLLFSGTLTLGVQGQLDVSEDPCDIANQLFGGQLDPLNVSLDSVNEQQAVISGGNSFIAEGTLSIPAGSGSLPSALCMEVPRAEAFASLSFAPSAQVKRNSSSSTESIAESMLNLIVPKAFAGQQVEPDLFSASAVLTNANDNEYMVVLQNENRGIRWSGTASTENASDTLSLDRVSCGQARSSTISVSLREVLNRLSGLPVSITLIVQELGISETLPENDAPLELPDICQAE